MDNVTQTSWVALPNVSRTPYPKGSDNITQDLWIERLNGKQKLIRGEIKMPKNFNEYEKKIIDKILELDEKGALIEAVNILTDKSKLLGRATFNFCIKDDELELFCEKKIETSNHEDINFLKDVEKKLYDFIFLIKYLEKEGYIVLIDTKNSPSSKSQLSQNIPLESYVSKEMAKLLRKEIKPLHNLLILKREKYLDHAIYSEIKRDWWYRILTIITIVVSIASAFLERACTSSVIIKNAIKIEKNQEDDSVDRNKNPITSKNKTDSNKTDSCKEKKHDSKFLVKPKN